MKQTKPQYYNSIETLPLYNFDKYRTTTDLNWFIVGYDGRQTKASIDTLQPIEKIILDEYFSAIDDRSFTIRMRKLGEIDNLKNKYNIIKLLIGRLSMNIDENNMHSRLVFIKELAKHGFKIPEINTKDGDAKELTRLNNGCEGIKTKIILLQKELHKDENKTSVSLTKQLLIAEMGLQIKSINPKKTSVLRWIEITKLLEEKSKQN